MTMPNAITDTAKERLKAIHRLSQEYNRLVGKEHQGRLVELIKKHAHEIEALLAQKDPHALVETGDLLILCFEMLLEHGVSMDETMNICFERYEKKLSGLMENLNQPIAVKKHKNSKSKNQKLK